MHAPSSFWMYVVLMAAIVAAFAFLITPARRCTFAQQMLLTENEREFFGRLKRALPDFYVFPQVAMSALIQPRGGTRKRRQEAFWKIAAKRVDYVVCDSALRVVCVIELDDRTHDPIKDKARDALFAAAGIPTIRWHSRNKPDLHQISDAVGALSRTPRDLRAMPSTALRSSS